MIEVHWCAFTADFLCVWFACVDLDSACCRPWGSLSSSSCTWIVPARSFRLSTCSQREAGAPMRCAWRHGIACVRRPSLPHARLAVFFAWMNGGQTQVTDDAAEFISKATVTGPTRVPTSVTPGGSRALLSSGDSLAMVLLAGYTPMPSVVHHTQAKRRARPQGARHSRAQTARRRVRMVRRQPNRKLPRRGRAM